MLRFDDAISPTTLALIQTKGPQLKEMIGDVTTSIISICHNEIAMKTTAANGTIGSEGSQEILDYINDLMEATGGERGFNLSLDYGINLFGECISLLELMRHDIHRSKLNADHRKQFIRTSQTCINYIDAYAKAS